MAEKNVAYLVREDTVNHAYKQNVKAQFRSLVLGSIDSQSAAKINMLLGIKVPE